MERQASKDRQAADKERHKQANADDRLLGLSEMLNELSLGPGGVTHLHSIALTPPGPDTGQCWRVLDGLVERVLRVESKREATEARLSGRAVGLSCF